MEDIEPLLKIKTKRCPKKAVLIQQRFVLTALGFLGFVNVYAMRVNLSVALVAMVKQTPTHAQSAACYQLIPNATDDGGSTTQTGEFDWDSSTQARALGAFFYGYVITQLPGGILAERAGSKYLYAFGILITAIFTLLTPIAARTGVGYLFVVRFVEGLGEGVTYPAMNSLIGRWVPRNERSRLATIIYNGSSVGTVISLAVSGFLSGTDVFGGWPSVFYLFGGLGIVWFFMWMFLVWDTPEENPYISKEELLLIYKGIDRPAKGGVRPQTPWWSILTSVPVWALVVTHFGQNWGFYTLLTEMPTYLSNILHFDIKQNGVLSALPYLMQACFAISGSVMADKLRASERFSITTIRKIFNSLAFYVPAVCVLLVTLVGCDSVAIMFLLSLSLGFNGFMFSGFNVTHVDMSPQFAGTLMGLTNCIANFCGFLAPAYVGRMTKTGQTLENWSIVFITTSIVFVITGTVYNIFCSAEPQPWGSTNQQQPTSSHNQPSSSQYQQCSCQNEKCNGQCQQCSSHNQPSSSQYQPSSSQYQQCSSQYQPSSTESQLCTSQNQQRSPAFSDQEAANMPPR